MANNSETKELSTTKSAAIETLSSATNFDDMTFSGRMVSKFLADNTDAAILTGREREREELVCRLLASGMPADEISVVLNIRVENIRIILISQIINYHKVLISHKPLLIDGLALRK